MSNNASFGHTLGGGGGGGASSPDEIRQRRLAALGGGSGGSATTSTNVAFDHNSAAPAATAAAVANAASAAGNSTNTAASPAEPPVKQTWFVEPEVDDDDIELQKALAMSLGNSTSEPMQAEISTTPVPAPTLKAAPIIQNNTVAPQQSSSYSSQNIEIIEDDDISRQMNHYTGLVEEWRKTADAFDISQFHAFMWDTGLTTDNDKSRWVGQAIDFRGEHDQGSSAQVPHGMEEGNTMLELLSKDHGPWGLVQSHGGPCGVLAAIQAELLRLLLFGRRNPIDYPPPLEPGAVPVQSTAELSSDLVRQALARAIAIILARAAVTPSAATSDENERRTVGIVLPSQSTDSSGLAWDDFEPWISPPDTSTKSTALNVYTITPKDPVPPNALAHKRQKINGTHESKDEKITKLARAVTAFLLDDGTPGRTAPLESFRKPGGVMILVMSLFATRGRDVIQGEMDDPSGTKLTSQFGHCGQELINLLLTGQAVSNVFDNTLTPSGELTCRGIQHRPNIGYLSQLESLRYCEVGGYYKSPHYPIWVVGSTSHFTVLFSSSTCLKESESDQLLEKCRRAFKAVEGGDENGFISSQSLGQVLSSLGVDLGGDSYLSTLKASLEVSDAGIILWDDFWKATSRLMTGASVEQVLNDAPIGPVGNNAGNDDIPPLLLTQNGEPVLEPDLDTKPSAKASNSGAVVESDEELAKRLSTQWDFESKPPAPAAASASSAATPMEVEPAALSDEDLARKLQAQWDAEVSGGTSNSVAAVHGGSQGSPSWSNFPDTNSSIATPDMTPLDDPSNPQEDTKEHGPKLDFEKYGDSFPLYHYNGLRGGTLTPFRVTRLSAEEAVGASIALNRGNNSHSGGSGSGDLEDVVRTKWPSCMINWLGRTPPYID